MARLLAGVQPGEAGGAGVAEELAEVVAGGEESPLGVGGVEPAEQDTFAALAGVDLAEHGLDNGFASGVGGLAGLGS